MGARNIGTSRAWEEQVPRGPRTLAGWRGLREWNESQRGPPQCVCLRSLQTRMLRHPTKLLTKRQTEWGCLYCCGSLWALGKSSATGRLRKQAKDRSDATRKAFYILQKCKAQQDPQDMIPRIYPAPPSPPRLFPLRFGVQIPVRNGTWEVPRSCSF